MCRLLTVGDENPGKVFFPGTESIQPRRFDDMTCALLISQSGQPTLMDMHDNNTPGLTQSIISIILDDNMSDPVNIISSDDYSNVTSKGRHMLSLKPETVSERVLPEGRSRLKPCRLEGYHEFAPTMNQ